MRPALPSQPSWPGPPGPRPLPSSGLLPSAPRLQLSFQGPSRVLLGAETGTGISELLRESSNPETGRAGRRGASLSWGLVPHPLRGGFRPSDEAVRVSCPRPRPGCGPGLQARWHRGPRRDASPCPLSMGHCSGGRRGAWGRAVWTRCPTDVPSLRPSQRTASPGAQCRRWAASGMAAGGSQPQSAGSAELGGCTAGRGRPMRPWGEAASAGVRRPRRQRGRSPPSTGSRPDPRRGPSPFSASAFRGAGSGLPLTLCCHRKLGLQANPEFQAESRLEPQPPFLLWRREVSKVPRGRSLG